jgi:hypothetical protein
MPDKNGWIYIYSSTLQMKIAYQERSGRIVCEDKTPYSMKEMELLVKSGQPADRQSHLVKKVFGGEITEAAAWKI